MVRSVEESFTAFYEGWLIKQQTLLDQILAVLSISSSNTITTDNDQESSNLISQVFNHYHDYFREKNQAAKEDVFLVLSPPWITSFERALIWVSCFKPSMLFLLIKNSMGEELSAKQAKLLQRIKAVTKREERRVEKAMALVQERVSGFALDGMLRDHGNLIDGETSDLDNSMEELKAAMLLVMENADVVRGATVRKVVDILSQTQTIKFLAAAAQFMFQTRSVGMHADSQIEASAASYVGGGGDLQLDETLPYDS